MTRTSNFSSAVLLILKSDSGNGLHRVTLERVYVSELLEIFKSDIHLCRQVQVRREAESVGPLVRLRLFKRDGRSRLICRLPLVIAN